jgi:hypothetical protein
MVAITSLDPSQRDIDSIEVTVIGEIHVFDCLKVFTMVRKKIDNRVRVLIENGVTLGHRTMFVIVGDKGRDQVSLFHFCDQTELCLLWRCLG